MPRTHTHHAHSRRARRQEGAVLFIVLMVVALSTLGATFAVQDSSYALRGARGVQQAVTARYAAESGSNSLPSLLGRYRPDDLRAMLLANAQLGGADGGAAFPTTKLNVPSMVGEAHWVVNVDDVEAMAYPAAADAGVGALAQDDRTPLTTRYEAVLESYCGGGTLLHLSVSAYGRQTLAWDEADGDYSGEAGFTQANDNNPYHDTVSLARSYYTAPLLNPCGGGSM